MPNSSLATGQQLAAQVTGVIHFLHTQGWTPATSSNFSFRLPENGFSVSISGLDKGDFTSHDFVEVDAAGAVTNPTKAHIRPSAETLLHSVVYRLFPEAQVVLHTHSVNGTVLSKLVEPGRGLWLTDFEILKGLEGVKSHEAKIWIPIFPNAQEMESLSKEVEVVLKKQLQDDQPVYGFLLAGHGLYTWGTTPAQAKRHVEVFEFLFEAILKLKQYENK